MYYNKFQNVNSRKNWEAYRKQRNYVAKLKKQSINNYFIERCTGGPKSKDFWRSLKCEKFADDGRQVMAIVHLDLWSR
jgi:hypothetical protein